MKEITDREYEQYQTMLKAAILEVKEKWEPKEQKYFFTENGEVRETSSHISLKSGRERSTRGLCKIASDRTIRANRISAWLDSEGSGEQEHIEGSANYYIYQSRSGRWITESSVSIYPDVVYMTKGDGNKLCAALNNGEIEL